MRLLIVEDDRDAAGYMEKGLKESGHAVDLAHTGREGLLRAASGDYDVLIVDRMLPELDGLGWSGRCAPPTTAPRSCSSRARARSRTG
jgi:two-component system OmpR family response regulator